MVWKTLPKDDAKAEVRKWEDLSSLDFLSFCEKWPQVLPEGLSDEYVAMRSEFLQFYKESESIKKLSGKKNIYAADLNLALNIYRYLTFTMGMTPIDASDDGIWRYIQVKVVPDIIQKRWKDEEERINAKRFWEGSKRMWLKTLWWYIYLSLQNESLPDTEKILKNNGIDDITQLIDRPGNGYRIELCRSIMKHYGNTVSREENLLRKVLKLNIIRCRTVEPALYEGGTEAYVKELFDYFGASHES